MADEYVATYAHGSGETLDYAIDWSPVLAAEGDTYLSVAWSATGGPTLGSSTFASGKASIWVAGGGLGDVYVLTCTLTTTLGRVHERSMRIVVIDR